MIKAGPADLDGTDFAREHRTILEQPRGAGYWLWKPWLIRKHLEAIGPDDLLVYSDASIDGYYCFDRLPSGMIERLRANECGYVIGPLLRQHGPLKRWVKRDALILMNADRPEIFDQPCVQASPNYWRPASGAFALLDAWLAAASDPRIITDQPNELGTPNHAGFVDHRHDQAILSILVHRDSLPVLDLAETRIFEAMALRPNALMTNRFLKSPHNLEAAAACKDARWLFWRALLMDWIARKLRRFSGSGSARYIRG